MLNRCPKAPEKPNSLARALSLVMVGFGFVIYDAGQTPAQSVPIDRVALELEAEEFAFKKEAFAPLWDASRQWASANAARLDPQAQTDAKAIFDEHAEYLIVSDSDLRLEIAGSEGIETRFEQINARLPHWEASGKTMLDAIALIDPEGARPSHHYAQSVQRDFAGNIEAWVDVQISAAEFAHVWMQELKREAHRRGLLFYL